MSSGSSTPQEYPARLSTADLFRHRREVLIEHAGRVYRLRLTSSGKLILTT
jgi:hemin uptake protein HemP